MHVTATGSHVAIWEEDSFHVYDTSSEKVAAIVPCNAKFMDISYPWMACAPHHRLCIYQAVQTKSGWPAVKLYDVSMDVRGMVFVSQSVLLVVWVANKSKPFWGLWRMRSAKPPVLIRHGPFPHKSTPVMGSATLLMYHDHKDVPQTMSLKTGKLVHDVDAIEYLKLRVLKRALKLDDDCIVYTNMDIKYTQKLRDGVEIFWQNKSGVTIRRPGDDRVTYFSGDTVLSADNRLLVKCGWKRGCDCEMVCRHKLHRTFEIIHIAHHLKNPPKTKVDLYQRLRNDVMFAAVRDVLSAELGVSEHVADNIMFFWK